MDRPRHVTHHAIERYRQRIADLPESEIFAALSSPAIMAAIRFGNCRVKLGTRHRVVILNGCVVTVLSDPRSPRANGGQPC